jgi:hypothetical protein
MQWAVCVVQYSQHRYKLHTRFTECDGTYGTIISRFLETRKKLKKKARVRESPTSLFLLLYLCCSKLRI